MLTDAILNFVPPFQPLSLVGGAGAAFQSQTVDLTGAGVGVAPPNIIGTLSVFGSDMFVGDKEVPQFAIAIGTTFTTSTACTLNTQVQAAVDTGSAGNYQPGTWTTLVETGYIGVTNLVKGNYLARYSWPPAFPASFQPRYFRINFQTLAGASFTAGTIGFALVTMARDDYSIAYAGKNFVVS